MRVFFLFLKSTLPKSIIILFALYTVADFCPPRLGKPIKAFTYLSPIALLFFYGTAAWYFYEQSRQAEADSKQDDIKVLGTSEDIDHTESQLSQFGQSFGQSLGQTPPVIDIQREPEVFTPMQHQPPVRSRPQNFVPADAATSEPRENVISFPADPWGVESDRSELDQILSEFRTRKSS